MGHKARWFLCAVLQPDQFAQGCLQQFPVYHHGRTSSNQKPVRDEGIGLPPCRASALTFVELGQRNSPQRLMELDKAKPLEVH
jgi:hypothetical protein